MSYNRSSGFSVYVGNLPYQTNEDDLGQFFASVGKVTNVRLVYDRDTNRSKGFGFCEFAEQLSAEKAVNHLDGVNFNGRALRVSYPNNK